MRLQLTWDEVAQAAHIGVDRRIASRIRNLTDAYGMAEDKPDVQWHREILGACGELVVAKALNLYWPMGVNQKKEEADLGGDVQVRTASHDTGLVIRPSDADFHRFMYVIGVVPNFEVVGWMYGAEGKEEKWLKDPGNRGSPAYFVPREALHDL